MTAAVVGPRGGPPPSSRSQRPVFEVIKSQLHARPKNGQIQVHLGKGWAAAPIEVYFRDKIYPVKAGEYFVVPDTIADGLSHGFIQLANGARVPSVFDVWTIS